MPAPAFTDFVFVDFENVQDIDLGLVAGQAVHVTLLIGKEQTSLDVGLVRQIHRLATQVDLVEVGASGHNALDLTLACYLGQAVQRQADARFHIVSRDHDFEPMLAHLVARGVVASRVDAFHLLPFVARPKPAPQPKPPAQPKPPVATKAIPAAKKGAIDKRAKILARLKNPAATNRPHTEKSLRAHIATGLGKESSPARVEEIFARLRGEKVFTVETDGHIEWTARKPPGP
jgi:hypothetical protein